MEHTNATLTPTEAMEILTNKRRAHTIDILNTHDSINIEDLVERIAEKESDGEPTPHDQTAITTSLRQQHIPKLTDHNVVRTDGDTISAGPSFDALHAAYKAVVSKVQ